MRTSWLVGVAALALALGVVVGLWQTTPPTPATSADQIYTAKFSDVDGRQQPLSQWRGKIMVINFWATWCPPCRSEIPDFVKVSQATFDKGVVFVGIALDEVDPVIRFAQEYGVKYPMLIGGEPGYAFAEMLGNRTSSIPYTVIVDRQGVVKYVSLGQLSREELEKQLNKLL